MTIFTKIINKEIPATILYEDDDVLAFLDIAQCTKGHTLVIPKTFSKDFLDTDVEVLKKVVSVAHMLANKIKDNLHPSGINILSNAGEQAGQGVFHYHLHIIPRYDENDGFSITYKENPNQDLEAIAQEIKKGSE